MKNNGLIDIDFEVLKDVCTSVIGNGLKIPSNLAGVVFKQYMEAEILGKKTHGLIRIPWLLSKGIEGHAEPRIETRGPVTYFDCSNSIGYIAAEEMVKFLNTSKADEDFKILVGKNIFPTGVLGSYVRKLMDKYTVLVFGTTPKMVRFENLNEKLFGTNPFAVGHKAEKGLNFLVDFTTASSSFGDLLASKYELQDFDQSKYETATGHIPETLSDLFDGENRFTGSVSQKMNTKADVKQYLVMFLVQALTELVSQEETKKGDLVFVAIKKDMFGSGSIPILEKLRSLSVKIPGLTDEDQGFQEMEKVSIPEKLWQEINELRPS